MKRKSILTLGIIIFSGFLFGQVSFNYSDFNKEISGLTLLADANYYDGALRLAKNEILTKKIIKL